MATLHFIRIEFDAQGRQIGKQKHSTRVHKEPVMPADVSRVREDAWQQVTRGEASMVIRTWWLTGAGMVA